MRRIPRAIQLIVAYYMRRLLKHRLDGHQLQAAIEAALRTLPIQEKLLVREGALRSDKLNRQLAWAMAFVAGAVNAGTFLAVGRYTSHMTGVVTSMADELAFGDFHMAIAALGMMVSFLAGAFFCTTLISYGQRHRMRSRYAFTLVVEAGLMLVFGFMGHVLEKKVEFTLPVTVILLCFIMGVHNAVTSIISGAAVRTTHMTGTVTDIGIELSKLTYVNIHNKHGRQRIVANRQKLTLYLLILASFLAGGVVGAVGFKHYGFKLMVPLAGFLCFLAARPLLLELRLLLHRIRKQWAPDEHGPSTEI